MASVRKRRNRWEARVRRKGYQTETKAFLTKTEANRWSQIIESEMTKGLYISRTEAERTTFGEIFDRYMREVSPTKRSGSDEIIRLKSIRRHRISELSMEAMTSSVLGD